jgi:hypothetical protein
MIVKVRGPIFWSHRDEDSFFAWLKSISAVKDVTGSGRDLWISLKRDRVPERDVRELGALFRRYKLDARPLARLGKRVAVRRRRTEKGSSPQTINR